MWSCACAPAPAAYRGGAEHFPPFGRKLQTPDWPAPPLSGDSPRSGSPRPCEQSVPQLPSRPGVGLGFDASSHRTCQLARDGDPEPIHFEETDANFTIDWKGSYRIEGAAFIYTDRKRGGMRAILGYPTQKLEAAARSS